MRRRLRAEHEEGGATEEEEIEEEVCWVDKRAVFCNGGREVSRDGRMDGCVEQIFTSVNSRVIALIAAVNNSKPLVGNSRPEETD